MMFYFTRIFSVQLFSGVHRHAKMLHLAMLLLAVTTINACGFQLRGAMDISQDIAPIYIQQNSAFEVAREIKALLVSNNISMAKEESEAVSQLTLIKEAKKQRVLSVDIDGRAREYLLTYTVSFSIKIKQEKPHNDSVSLTRSLLFDTGAVVAVANESETLYKDMQRDASRLILLKLQAQSLNHMKHSAGPAREVPAELAPVESEAVESNTEK